jgi:hypothetical protein
MPILGTIASSWKSAFVNTPPVTSGLTHWYDASDATTMTISSGNVSQWNNKSPASGGPNFTQGTGSRQPDFTSSARNGRSAVKFIRANDDNLGSSSQPSSGSITNTVCFAGQTTQLASNAQVPVSWGTSNAVGAGYALSLLAANDPLGAGRVNAGLAGNQGTAGVVSANSYSGLWYAQVVTISGASQTQAVNKTDTGTQNATSSSVSANNEFFLGWLTNPWYGTYGWNGFIGDVLIYNRVLNATERTQMADWLMQKWAIS